MRFHSAAAFLLAKGGFGPSNNNNNEFALKVRDTLPSILPGTALKMTPNEEDPVAGAFNNLNENMVQKDGETLDALKELSDSFKQLAQADVSSLFSPPQGITTAEVESLDTTAPLAGSTFNPPHLQTFYSDTAAEGASYLESLKSSAEQPAAASSSYLENLAGAASPPAGTAGSSYLDAIQGQTYAPNSYSSLSSQPEEAAATAGTSYLDAIQGQTHAFDATAYSSSPPQPEAVATAYSSPPAAASAPPPGPYLDSIAEVQSQSSAPKQTYAPSSASWRTTPVADATTTNMPASYLDAYRQGAASTSPQAAEAQPGSYLDSIAGSSLSQPEETTSYPPAPPVEQPPVQQETTNPYMGEATISYADPSTPVDATITDFAPDNEDVVAAGRAPKVEVPRVRTVQPNPGFNPDVDWDLPPTRATPQAVPGFSAQRGAPVQDWGQEQEWGPPNVPPPQPERIGSQRVSGYIPNLQGGQGMNGAMNTPEPKPKAPRPVFSRKMSGIHSDFDEKQTIKPSANEAPPTDNVRRVPRATPKAPVFSRKMSGIHSDFDGAIINPAAKEAPPTDNVRFVPRATPKAPMSVFAERISGIAADNEGMMNPGGFNAPLTPEPKPRRSVAAQRVKDIPDWQNDFAHPTHDVTGRPTPPVSVFAKRVKGTADFSHGPPASAKPEPPRSVFAQNYKGVADFNGNNGPPPARVPKPEPPRSIFSQRVKGVADFDGAPPSLPRPEPPRSVFAQKISSNVPRAVAASTGGDFAANGNVPIPNPRAAASPQQQQHYGRGDFAPDYSDQRSQRSQPREIPLPDYTPGQNHQDRLTSLDSSFMVNPDDRIGSTRDEYLR